MIEECLPCAVDMSYERYARVLPEMVHLVESTNL
jgi:hypothetical protein